MYISLIVDCSTRRNIGKLQPLQNRAVKIISARKDYVSTEEMKMHDQLGLLLHAVRADESLC